MRLTEKRWLDGKALNEKGEREKEGGEEKGGERRRGKRIWARRKRAMYTFLQIIFLNVKHLQYLLCALFASSSSSVSPPPSSLPLSLPPLLLSSPLLPSISSFHSLFPTHSDSPIFFAIFGNSFLPDFATKLESP